MVTSDELASTTGYCCSLELVWDEALNATAVTDRGMVRIGPDASLTPHHLLALAASSELMTTVLTAAAARGVAIQGYVSSVRLRGSSDQTPDLALAPCVVVASDQDRERIEALWPEAVNRTPTLRLLGPHVQLEPTVRVAPRT
jgi:uncharacterized OsmC-like protein